MTNLLPPFSSASIAISKRGRQPKPSVGTSFINQREDAPGRGSNVDKVYDICGDLADSCCSAIADSVHGF